MSTNSALRQAEQDTLAEILSWVQEVVEGRGNSAAQMVVTVVLGCVPYVGQAIDVYNILRSIYSLTKAPNDSSKWVDLVLSLVALVPLFGDALKNVFLMLRNGKRMGRILDSLPNKVRGNIEKWFRELNWAQYTRELTRSMDNILAGMIEVLEYQITRWALGRQGVQRLIAQLKQLKQMAARQIDGAMNSLRQQHQKALLDPLPSTAGHTPALPTRPATPRPTPGTQAPPTMHRTTAGTRTPSRGMATATKRQSQRSNQKPHQTAVSGEHISDYYFVRRQHSRQKVSNRGVLYEMKQPSGALALGHQGIDHVWHGSRLPSGYRVSDTKATAGAMHKLETAKATFQALEYGIDAYLGEEDEAKARNAVNHKTTRSGKQMSHRWIADRIDRCGLLSQHAALMPKVKAWEFNDFKLGAQTTYKDAEMQRSLVKCPYDRSIITVVGPNLNQHDNAKGVTAGRCAKGVASHQIATEFVLPNTILLE